MQIQNAVNMFTVQHLQVYYKRFTSLLQAVVDGSCELSAEVATCFAAAFVLSFSVETPSSGCRYFLLFFLCPHVFFYVRLVQQRIRVCTVQLLLQTGDRLLFC